MMHKAWSSIEEVAYCFSRSFIKFQGYMGQKIANFELNWEFPDSSSSLNSLHDVFEMIHKAWRSIEEVPYNFSRPAIKFQGHTGNKINDVNPVWVRLIGQSHSNCSDLIDMNHIDSEESQEIRQFMWDSKYDGIILLPSNHLPMFSCYGHIIWCIESYSMKYAGSEGTYMIYFGYWEAPINMWGPVYLSYKCMLLPMHS